MNHIEMGTEPKPPRPNIFDRLWQALTSLGINTINLIAGLLQDNSPKNGGSSPR